MDNPFNTTFTTDRLVIRPLTINDASDMFEYTSDQNVTKYLSWYPHNDITQTAKFISEVLQKYKNINTEFTFGLELKSENKLIGVVKVLNISYYNRRAEFTSILNPFYQGKGYMNEAWNALLDYCFNIVGLNRIQSYVTSDNQPSQRKNARLGLKKEGRIRDWWLMKGEFKDALVYSITAIEFNDKRHLSKG